MTQIEKIHIDNYNKLYTLKIIKKNHFICALFNNQVGVNISVRCAISKYCLIFKYNVRVNISHNYYTDNLLDLAALYVIPDFLPIKGLTSKSHYLFSFLIIPRSLLIRKFKRRRTMYNILCQYNS